MPDWLSCIPFWTRSRYGITEHALTAPFMGLRNIECRTHICKYTCCKYQQHRTFLGLVQPIELRPRPAWYRSVRINRGKKVPHFPTLNTHSCCWNYRPWHTRIRKYILWRVSHNAVWVNKPSAGGRPPPLAYIRTIFNNSLDAKRDTSFFVE